MEHTLTALEQYSLAFHLQDHAQRGRPASKVSDISGDALIRRV
jgi:hypothetical protein